MNHIFSVYFQFEGIIPKQYVDHLFLLSSALYKIYSISSTPEELFVAREELDLFIRIIRDERRPATVELSRAFRKLNTHYLVHLYDDRVNLGSPSLYNAYGYEGLLQEASAQTNSPNIRIETLTKRMLLIRKANLTRDERPECELHNEMKLSDVSPTLIELVRQHTQLDDQQLSRVKFYKRADVKGGKIRTESSDAFIKTRDSHFGEVNLT